MSSDDWDDIDEIGSWPLEEAENKKNRIELIVQQKELEAAKEEQLLNAANELT